MTLNFHNSATTNKRVLGDWFSTTCFSLTWFKPLAIVIALILTNISTSYANTQATTINSTTSNSDTSNSSTVIIDLDSQGDAVTKIKNDIGESVQNISIQDNKQDNSPAALIEIVSPKTKHKLRLQISDSQPKTVNRATDFTLKRFQGPNTRLLDHRGDIVLINFWATWCGPCRQEIPLLMELQEKFKNDRFVVLGITIDTNHREVEQFLHDMLVTYPILFDEGQVLSEQFEVKAMPSSFILDRDGIIRFEHIGFKPNYAELYIQEIQKLIDE